MQPAAQLAPKSQAKARVRAGWIIGGLCVLFLFVDAGMKILNIVPVREAMVRLGYQESLGPALGILLLVCTIAYVVPKTSVLGAVLLTGYLGGATTTHVRIADPFWFPILMGALLWTGLLLRDPKLREIFPVRR